MYRISRILIGLAIACQLLGLLDVLGDPAFLNSGGWFQPVTASSFSTIPTLVQRFSTNSVLFLGTATLLSLLNNSNQDEGDDSTNTNGVLDQHAVLSKDAVIRTSLRMTGTFFIVRVALATIVASTLTDTGSNFTDEWSAVLVEAVRECYFVALGTTASRFALYWLYFRDNDEG